MVVGEMADPVDVLVVGGGPGGYTAALRAAQAGRQVVLVDRDGPAGLGGTCVHVGCIPSKALIELGNAHHGLAGWGPAGLSATGVRLDMPQFHRWKAGLVAGLAAGIETLLAGSGVQVLTGAVTFNRVNQAAVATPDGNVRFLEFRHAVLATGSVPIELPALPRDGHRVLNSTDALALEEIPASLLVVGSGYIGVELGTAFAKLGAEVTIVEQCERFLPGVDAAISGLLRRSCTDLGIRVLTSSEVREVTATDVLIGTPDGERRLQVDAVVVAAGRVPATAGLGLAAAGITLTPSGHVRTDEACLATPLIAAVGDVRGGPALAHAAMAEAEAAVRTLGGARTSFDPLVIPAVVFSDPEVALVGLTEAAARAAGLDVAVGQFPLSASGRAAVLRAPRGFARVVVDRSADVLVGVALVGPHVSELAGEAALAIEMGSSPADLAAVIHPHPTISESLAEAAGVALGRPLHVRSATPRLAYDPACQSASRRTS